MSPPNTSSVFVLGSFVVGVTVGVPRWLVPGETLLGDTFDLGPGGKGTNQAIAAARQSAKVTLIAAIGNDVFGRMALALYEQEGLRTKHIYPLTDERTGCGIRHSRWRGKPNCPLSRSQSLSDIMSGFVHRAKFIVRTGAFNLWENIVLHSIPDVPKWFEAPGVKVPSWYQKAVL